MAPAENASRSDNDVGDGNGEQQLPTDIHKLVIAEAGQRAARPYIKKEEKENFAEQPERSLNIYANLVKRSDPESRKEQRTDSRDSCAQAGKNHFAKNGLVFDAVEDHPQAEG